MSFFGHQHISRTVIVSFMDWFTDLQIERYTTATSSAGTSYVSRKLMKVPVQFAAREKWYEIFNSSAGRKAMDPAIRDKNTVEMQWILPRISVNLTGVTYDQVRRQIKTQQIKDPSSATAIIYTPAPYNLDIEVSVITKHIDDQLQIMEQILPSFSTTKNFDIRLFADKSPDSVPFVLSSVMPDLPVDIAESDERLFTFTYLFTAKVNYYAQKKSGLITKSVSANVHNAMEYTTIYTDWIEAQDIVQQRFENYVNIASTPNPFVTG